MKKLTVRGEREGDLGVKKIEDGRVIQGNEGGYVGRERGREEGREKFGTIY